MYALLDRLTWRNIASLLSEWGPGLAMVVVVVALYDTPRFIWSVPGLALIAMALASLAMSLRKVPVTGSLFFLAGAASLLWSLTPGNTLLNTLWEAVYLAALGVGGSIASFALVNLAMLYVGLERTLLLDYFGVNQYFSGSLHYLAGAQALLFVPIALKTAVRGKTQVLRVGAAVVSTCCFLLILNSGARAVYLPAVVLLPLVVVRLALPKGQRVRALAIPLASLLLLFGLSAALPGPTISTPLGLKLGQTDSELNAQPVEEAGQTGEQRTVSEEGGIGSRLKMWDQTLRIGLDHPFGTGAGSFRNTIHAFQRYPLIGFSSPHNVFLETWSTGGWIRLVLLLVLVVGSVWRGWWSERWPIAAGGAAIWATMSFDITGQMPVMVALAFWSLAASNPLPSTVDTFRSRARLTAALVAAIVVAVAGGWWYWPCMDSERCAVGRHLGYRAEVLDVYRSSDAGSRNDLAQRSVELNPSSLWAWQIKAEQAESRAQRVEANRELAARFPFAGPRLYLDWAQSALVAGRHDEAKTALTRGLEAFPPDLNPAGIPYGGRTASYSEWLNRATSMLSSLEDAERDVNRPQ